MHAAGIDERRGRLAALRTLVAEKFPALRPAPVGRLCTGCAALDRRGGLARGALTEVCGSSGGGQLVLAAVLDMAVREGFFLGLIDGADALEPADWPPEHLQRLLWVRCGGSHSALKATDILMRDGNLPLLLLDLQIVPIAQLRRIPVSTWHRFHRLLEHSSTILLVLTPQPMVEAAPCRIVVRPGTVGTPETSGKLWEASRAQLLADLEVRIFERGEVDFQISA
jgi:hypothetical protein